MRGLTPKQQRFVEEYLVDLNATQAAIRAGYSAKLANTNAPKLLRNTAISEAIAEQRAKVSERTMRTIEDVMADIGRVRDNAMQMVIDTQTGAQSMLSHKDAIRALELEGKHLGAFVERQKVEHSGNVGVGLDATKLPSDVLAAIISAADATKRS